MLVAITVVIMFQNLLVNGAVVHLWSKKSGYTLMISDHGNVSAKGRNDDHGEHLIEYC